MEKEVTEDGIKKKRRLQDVNKRIKCIQEKVYLLQDVVRKQEALGGYQLI